ncbi:hypothetical protein PHLGIDRAFT_534838 [Phlebiopsis gigantea 11061_1 CR5-6]|uniref:ABC transmembrane type-1 domain-containing protein n=1 Tax=Phlebiopsis gigantea (strain 11061_1 CR5-6) TaxID=745531 RepID=A0A0C3S4T6_PHLG1|nr:hypothetical protein PHLGIDRAFT_534838 [Phlebiopsis gigantea 11061_1 CR5-6]
MDVTGQQVVLTASLDDGGRGEGRWLDEIYIPSYVAAVSLLALSTHAVWSSKLVKVLRGLRDEENQEHRRSWKGFMLAQGGVTIWSFKVIRLAGVLGIFWLGQTNLVKAEWAKPDTFIVAPLAYALLLALFNVLAPSRYPLRFSWHLSLVASAILTVYIYRDIWPLMTLTLQPKDGAEGTRLWVKIGLLFFVGTVLPLFEPYPYIPYDPSHPAREASPEQTASIASFLTYVWLDPTIWRASQVAHLSHDDLPPLCDYDEIKTLVKRSYTKLDPFSGAKSEGHLFWGLAKIFRQSLFYQSLALVAIAGSRMAVPIGLNRLLAYLETGGEGAVVKPWVWILWLGLGPISKTVFWELYLFLSTRSLARTQAIFTSLIFDHALRIRFKAETSEKKDAEAPAAHSASSAGSSDGADAGAVTTADAPASDTATVVDPASEQAAGKDGKKDAEEEDAEKDDNLVGKLNNLVTSDLENITQGRDFLFIVLFIPLLGILSMIFLYAVLGWSSIVGLAVMIVLSPAPSWVAAETNDVQDEKMKATDARVQSVTEAMGVLRMIKLFGWESRVSEQIAEQRAAEIKLVWTREVLDLSNVSLATIIPVVHMVVTYAIYTVVMKQQLTASVVFSSVAAFDMFRMQMASVLMALLGEMHYMPCAPDARVSLPRRGGVAFAVQESWVQNDTIKNILFGAPYDEDRYKKVIYQCALTRDLSLFDAGDATEVGEKGITLSGGQKARITLARAVYSSAQTLLLDDVLAALDVHTSRWIVDKCFKGDLIRGRTVILVTHNVALVSPIADFVVSLHGGRITSQGSVSDALKTDHQLAEEFKNDKEALELEVNEEHETDATDDPAATPAKTAPEEGKLVVAEEVAVGHVSWKAYMLLITSLGGSWPLFFWLQFLGVNTLFTASNTFESWWLGYWARQYAWRDPSDVRVSFKWISYLGVYVAIVAISVFALVYACLVWCYGSMRASRKIHAKLLKSLLGSTFRWLDVTPMSRIITRCTQDIQAVDDSIPSQLYSLISTTINLVVALAAVVLYTPVFLLPAVIVAVAGGLLGHLYIKAQLSIKREMSNAKAPVLGVFTSTTAGLTSIRAYAAQTAFQATLHERIDKYTRASRSLYNVNRWISVRLDTLGQLFTTSLAFYLVYGARADPSSVGFVLGVAASFSDQILWWVRAYNSLEVSSNSLERIQQYLEIEHEPEPKDAGKPPAYWPSSGELRVEKLSARYSEGPTVLQDISFHARLVLDAGRLVEFDTPKALLKKEGSLLRALVDESADRDALYAMAEGKA